MTDRIVPPIQPRCMPKAIAPPLLIDRAFFKEIESSEGKDEKQDHEQGGHGRVSGNELK